MKITLQCESCGLTETIQGHFEKFEAFEHFSVYPYDESKTMVQCRKCLEFLELEVRNDNCYCYFGHEED